MLTLAALLLAFFSAVSVAQDFQEEIEVEEVLLDVQVTDENGQIVTNLGPDDFIVRVDGAPAVIQSANYLDLSSASPEAAATPTHRYFILFFHHQRSLLPRLGANLLDAGRRAKQWVGSLRPNDYVAVVSYWPKYHLLDFTNDEAVLRDAIDAAAQGLAFTPTPGAASAGIPSLVANLPEGDVDRIYEALAMTAHAAGEVRGRKNLILFSIGFGEVDSFGFYTPDMRYYPEMIQTINDNNVAVYPVDLLATDVSPFFRYNRLQHVLSRMAIESSGEMYVNFTNYLTPLERTAEDNRGYYLISFTPPGDAERGTYREVDVETLDANLDTKAREGYVVGDVYPYGK